MSKHIFGTAYCGTNQRHLTIINQPVRVPLCDPSVDILPLLEQLSRLVATEKDWDHWLKWCAPCRAILTQARVIADAE